MLKKDLFVSQIFESTSDTQRDPADNRLGASPSPPQVHIQHFSKAGDHRFHANVDILL
jgi:hypothetical protein